MLRRKCQSYETNLICNIEKHGIEDRQAEEQVPIVARTEVLSLPTRLTCVHLVGGAEKRVIQAATDWIANLKMQAMRIVVIKKLKHTESNVCVSVIRRMLSRSMSSFV